MIVHLVQLHCSFFSICLTFFAERYAWETLDHISCVCGVCVCVVSWKWNWERCALISTALYRVTSWSWPQGPHSHYKHHPWCFAADGGKFKISNLSSDGPYNPGWYEIFFHSLKWFCFLYVWFSEEKKQDIY